MDRPDSILVNSAIQRLLDNPHDDEAAGIIITYGNALPPQNKYTYEKHSHKYIGPGTEVTGHTPEHGNVSLQQGERVESKETYHGKTIERVGHYKLWKVDEGIITFQYYWKADLTTRGLSKPPDEYSIVYNPSNLSCRDVVLEFKKSLFRLGCISIGRIFWRSLRDETTIHRKGWYIKIEIYR